jgi:hypothetical protein
LETNNRANTIFERAPNQSPHPRAYLLISRKLSLVTVKDGTHFAQSFIETKLSNTLFRTYVWQSAPFIGLDKACAFLMMVNKRTATDCFFMVLHSVSLKKHAMYLE